MHRSPDRAVLAVVLGSGTALRRVITGSALVLAGLLWYRGLQCLVHPYASCETEWDRRLPFIPWMIWPYAALLPYALAAAWSATQRTFPVIVWAGLSSLLIASFCFLVEPMTMHRPDLSALPSGPTLAALAWLHRHDAIHNTFPSMHVALAWVCAWALRATAHAPWWRSGAALISLSTLLVKQHTLLDVAGGIVLAWITVGAAEWWLRPPAGMADTEPAAGPP